MCFSWTNKELSIINMRGATTKIHCCCSMYRSLKRIVSFKFPAKILYTFLVSCECVIHFLGPILRFNFVSWTAVCTFKLSFYFMVTLKRISKKLRRRRRGGCLLILNKQSRVTDGEGGLGVRPKIPLPVCSWSVTPGFGFRRILFGAT